MVFEKFLKVIPGYSDVSLFKRITALVFLYFFLSNWADESRKWIVVAFGLSAFVAWYSLEDEPTPFEYLANFNLETVKWIGLGIAGLFASSLVFAGLVFKDMLSVTHYYFVAPELTSAFFPFIPALTSPLNTLLWQLFLVANAEETVKFAFQSALYDRFDHNWGVDAATILGFGIPIIIWASMHTMLSYTSGNILGQVVAAVAAGIVLTVVMYKTKSLMAAIVVHAAYNTLLTIM